MNRTRSIRASRRAILLTEACVSIMLVGIVLAAVSLLLTQYARSTDYFLNYRRAQLAAESCVERLRAGVLQLEDATFTDAAGVNCRIRVSEAEGTWAPLRRVRVTTTVMGKHGRSARYEITTYVAGTALLEGGDR